MVEDPNKKSLSVNSSAIFSAAIGNTLFGIILALFQIIIVAVQSRVLEPSDFGVFALANTFLVIVMHISQRGLVTAMVTDSKFREERIHLWYSSCILLSLISIILISLISAIIFSLSDSAGQKSSAAILCFMSLPLLTQIMMSPALAARQRKMAFLSINLVALFGMAVGNGLIGISFALMGFGPWSLAFGAAVNACIACFIYTFLERESVGFKIKNSELLKLIGDAASFNGLRVLDIAWLQLPVIFFGFSQPMSVVGLYHRAQMLADLAIQTSVWRVSSVLYASKSQSILKGRVNASEYFSDTMVLATLSAPISVFLFVARESIVITLLGADWIGTADIFGWLSIGFGAATLMHAAGIAFEHARNFLRFQFFCFSLSFLKSRKEYGFLPCPHSAP